MTSCPPEITVSSTGLSCHLHFLLLLKNPIQKRSFTHKPSHQGLPQAEDPAYYYNLCYWCFSARHTEAKYSTTMLPLNMRVTDPGQCLICPCVLLMARIKAPLLVVSRLHRIMSNTAVLHAVCYTILCKSSVSANNNRRPARPLLDNQ